MPIKQTIRKLYISYLLHRVVAWIVILTCPFVGSVPGIMFSAWYFAWSNNTLGTVFILSCVAWLMVFVVFNDSNSQDVALGLNMVHRRKWKVLRDALNRNK